MTCDQFAYEYDANGNLTKKVNKATAGITSYTYNAENQITRIDYSDGGYSIYRYDGLGRRIEKNINGAIAKYIYDKEDILLEYDGANNFIARYTHGTGIDEPLIMERGGQSYYYHADGLGSITCLTDFGKNIVQSYVYDAFGNIVEKTGSLINPYTYTGREYDPESGLYYYRARYYDAKIGRFLQEDPIGFLGGFNFYLYCVNNPIRLIDPLGWYNELAGLIHGEIGGLRPQLGPNGEWDQSSLEEYIRAGQAIGNVSRNGGKLGNPLYEPNSITWPSNTESAQKALQNDMTDGSRHFYIRSGPLGGPNSQPWWANGQRPNQSYGPFRNPIGSGDVSASSDVWVDVYQGVR